ncbi:hypothetical protein D030_2968B, partial [Vibrio parahaemolyticus AQ3810]
FVFGFFQRADKYLLFGGVDGVKHHETYLVTFIHW